jgi:type II secretory pathway component GspD/PulD (secretin)
MRKLMMFIFVFLLLGRMAEGAITYCNITEIVPTQLANGVQIQVKADGVLSWVPGVEGGWERFFGKTREISIKFPQAKSKLGKNFIDVSMYPVSYIQVSIPQDAKEGVGILMNISLFEPSNFRVDESSDRQAVIITVMSERTIEKGVRREVSAIPEAEGKFVVVYEEGLLTVKAVRADIHELMGEIARKASVNITVDDAVRRKVSVVLEGVSVEKALRSIASAYGLALLKSEDVYMISEGMPTDLATYRLSGTASFRMRYLQAQTASSLLPNFLYSYLHVNGEQNAVVVTAPTQMLEKIERDLKVVDVAPPQIMVDAIAVETTSTEDLDRELNLKLLDRSLQKEEESPTGLSMGTLSGEIFYRVIGELPKNFLVQLRLLETKGLAKIRAMPRMAALNGHSADIFIGAQKFIQVRFWQWGQLQERIQAVDVGVKLRVTPWTGGGGEITVRLSPEVSNITELDPQTGLPTLSTRRAETTVRVKDGETIAIGGLKQRQEYDTIRRIPILGHIPLIGKLFQSRKKNYVNSDLMIFITPRILPEGGIRPEEMEKDIRDMMGW